MRILALLVLLAPLAARANEAKKGVPESAQAAPAGTSAFGLDEGALEEAAAQLSPIEIAPEPPSKKQQWLAEKSARKNVRLRAKPAPGAAAVTPVSLVNVWTHEVLPVDPKAPPAEPLVNRFLRCHYTNQATAMDPRLVPVALAAAAKFKALVVEVVSGYRAPKYNLMLRKKGHEVGRDSQHPMGHALDFRVPGLAAKKLLRFVRSLGRGGVGYYPESSFVHTDVGPVRFWRGH